MTKRNTDVPRPVKKSEYRLQFHSNQAAKGWADLLAALRNATVDAWDRLSTAPEASSQRQYVLQGDFAEVTREGKSYARWQYKVSDGARIWYFVTADPVGKSAGIVWLERCMTGHPKQTDRSAAAG